MSKNHQWYVSLNNSQIQGPNQSPKSQHKIIGKNITFTGDSSYYYRNNDIILIGYGRIYNETDLWIDILKITMPLVKIHPLLVVIELYNKFGFERMMEYLDGDFSFILFDINLYGDESIIYVVRDPFGLCPLYKWVSKNASNSPSSKRVQFQNDTVEQPIYVFSSSSNYMDIEEIETNGKENMILESINNGTYLTLTHSFKVSANWRFKNACTYYILPYHTTYKDEDDIPININKQLEITINKTIQYILHYENALYSYSQHDEKIKIGMIEFEKEIEQELSILPYLKKRNKI